MNAYFNLFYLQHAAKFPGRMAVLGSAVKFHGRVAVLGSSVAKVGGWLVRYPKIPKSRIAK